MAKLVLFYEPRSSDEMDTILQRKPYCGDTPVKIAAFLEISTQYENIHALLKSRSTMERKPFACMVFDDKTAENDNIVLAAAKADTGLPVIFMAHEAYQRNTLSGYSIAGAVVKASPEGEKFIAGPEDVVLINNQVYNINCITYHPTDSDRSPAKKPAYMKKFMANAGKQIRGNPVGKKSPTSWTGRTITQKMIDVALKSVLQPTPTTFEHPAPTTAAQVPA